MILDLRISRTLQGETYDRVETHVEARDQEDCATSEQPDDWNGPEPGLVSVGLGPERIVLRFQGSSEAERGDAKHEPHQEKGGGCDGNEPCKDFNPSSCQVNVRKHHGDEYSECYSPSSTTSVKGHDF